MIMRWDPNDPRFTTLDVSKLSGKPSKVLDHDRDAYLDTTIPYRERTPAQAKAIEEFRQGQLEKLLMPHWYFRDGEGI